MLNAQTFIINERDSVARIRNNSLPNIIFLILDSTTNIFVD